MSGLNLDQLPSSVGNWLNDRSITPGVKESAELACDITLENDTDYSTVEFHVHSQKEVLWEIFRVDDLGGADTRNEVLSFETGQGQQTHAFRLESESFKTPAAGVSVLRITGEQLVGSGSDSELHAYLGVLKNP